MSLNLSNKLLNNLAKKYKVKNMIGLNRFYSNFDKGINFLRKKGGIKGILIEGHEDSENKEKNQVLKLILCKQCPYYWFTGLFGGEVKQLKSLITILPITKLYNFN